MKHRLYRIVANSFRKGLFTVMLLGGAMQASAQTKLSGHTYYNANIMAEELKNLSKDVIDSELSKAREKAVAEFKEEKGRKPTQAEMAEIDKQLKEARVMVDALKKGMKTAITYEFKNEKDVVMKADISIDDDALKEAGIGWLQRQALKASLAMAPSSKSGTYRVVGKTVYINAGNAKDTLQLSDDGKYIFGKFEDTKYKLSRTK